MTHQSPSVDVVAGDVVAGDVVAGEELRARFNPVVDDYVEFGRRALPLYRLMRRRTMTRRARAVTSALSAIALACLALTLASSLYLTLAADIKFGILAFFAGVFLWAFLTQQRGWGAARRARAEFAKDPRRGDEVVAEADQGSFRYFSQWVRYEIGWEAVAGVYATAEQIFVFDQDRLTYMVPRRGFASVEQSQRFEKWVERRAAFKP
jgi:hypothetical protein